MKGENQIDKQAMHDDLTDAFIEYQYRLEHPMPVPYASRPMMIEKYRSDPLFRNKVDSLVSGIVHIIGRYIDA